MCYSVYFSSDDYLYDIKTCSDHGSRIVLMNCGDGMNMWQNSAGAQRLGCNTDQILLFRAVLETNKPNVPTIYISLYVLD